MMELKLTIDLTNQAELQTAVDMLSKLIGSPKVEAKVAEPKKEAAKKTAAPVAENTAETTTAPAASETPKEEVSEDVPKIDDIRLLLNNKVGEGFRDKIKAKLTELGATSLTVLDVKHHKVFNDFLNGLK